MIFLSIFLKKHPLGLLMNRIVILGYIVRLKFFGLLEIYIQLLVHLSDSRLATGDLEDYLIRSLDKTVRTYILPNLNLVEKELCFLSQRVSDDTVKSDTIENLRFSRILAFYSELTEN